METEKRPNVLQRFVLFVENDSQTAKVLSYGIASVGLSVALYRIRPFAKFKKPSDVPSRFLKTKVPLQGTVVRVQPDFGTILMVDHKPLIPLPGLTTPKYLPVKMAGVNVTTHGISWLQTVVCGKQITFVPLAKKPDYLECMVTMKHNQEHLKIGEELVKIGFAMVEEVPVKSTTDKEVLAYKKCLVRAQKWAERKRNGYWQFAKHPTVLWKLQMSLEDKIKSVWRHLNFSRQSSV